MAETDRGKWPMMVPKLDIKETYNAHKPLASIVNEELVQEENKNQIVKTEATDANFFSKIHRY